MRTHTGERPFACFCAHLRAGRSQT
jgi:hypothetical protein